MSTPVTELPFHPVADIYPLMTGEPFEALEADIKEKGGCIYGVWTYQGQVIDGRNLVRACRDLVIVPPSKEWDGKGSLVGFVQSLNGHRRHLTTSQQAMAAAKALPLLEEEAKKRMSEGGKKS